MLAPMSSNFTIKGDLMLYQASSGKYRRFDICVSVIQGQICPDVHVYRLYNDNRSFYFRVCTHWKTKVKYLALECVGEWGGDEISTLDLMSTIDLTFDSMNRGDYTIEESDNYVSTFEVKVFNEPRPYYATTQQLTSHNHDDRYAKTSHKHTMADITDLQIPEVDTSNLASKDHKHTMSDITDLELPDIDTSNLLTKEEAENTYIKQISEDRLFIIDDINTVILGNGMLTLKITANNNLFCRINNANISIQDLDRNIMITPSDIIFNNTDSVVKHSEYDAKIAELEARLAALEQK